MKFLHFTSVVDAEKIVLSKTLWSSAYISGVYAVVEGGHFISGVQLSKLGRTKDRSVAVLFSTRKLPDVGRPEEIIWHLPQLEIIPRDILLLEDARKLLDESLPIDPDTDMVQIPLHPSVNNFDVGTVRLPEDLKPWTPGKDNAKYETAMNMFRSGFGIDEIVSFWREA